jgi:hypothetical protein
MAQRKLPPSIVGRVRREFHAEDQQAVLKALSCYGAQSHEREKERVLRAVLYLADGDKEAVNHLVEQARRDYRDVLLWAENRRKSRLDTPPGEKWLKKRVQKLCRRLGIEGPFPEYDG